MTVDLSTARALCDAATQSSRGWPKSPWSPAFDVDHDPIGWTVIDVAMESTTMTLDEDYGSDLVAFVATMKSQHEAMATLVPALIAEVEQLRVGLREALDGWSGALADRTNQREWAEIEVKFDAIYRLDKMLEEKL